MPNQLTDTNHGELFVIRNAGNSVPSQSEVKGLGDSDAATVEYAVKALAVKEIVVCGHSNCGAMGALCSGVDASLVNINTYLKRLDPLKATFTEKTTVEEAINENIKYQLDNLMSYDFVKEAVEAGKLSLHGWLYNLDSGEVEEIQSISNLN
jgi:carbonic anhydrase